MELAPRFQADGAVARIRFHPQLPLLATVAAEKDEIGVWNVDRTDAPKLVTRIARGDPRAPNDVAWHPIQAILAVAREFSPVELRDAGSGALIRTMQAPPLPGWSGEFYGYTALAFCVAGETLFAGRTIAEETEAYDAATGVRRSVFWPSDTSLALHPEGELLATLGNQQSDTTVRFAGTGDPLRGYDIALSHIGDGYERLLFSPRGDLLAIPLGSLDMTVLLHAFPSLELLWMGCTEEYDEVQHLEPPSERPWDEPELFWRRAQKRASVAGYDGQDEPERFWSRALRVAFSPDGRSLLLAGLEGMMTELPCDSLEPSHPWRAHYEPIATIEVGHRQQLLATAGFSGEVRLWPLPHPVAEPDPHDRPLTAGFLEMAREIELSATEDQLRTTDGRVWFDDDSRGEEVDETARSCVKLWRHLTRQD